MSKVISITKFIELEQYITNQIQLMNNKTGESFVDRESKAIHIDMTNDEMTSKLREAYMNNRDEAVTKILEKIIQTLDIVVAIDKKGK